MSSFASTTTTNASLTQPSVRLSPKDAAQRLHALLDSPTSSSSCESTILQIVEIAVDLTGALGVIFLERDSDQRLVVRPQQYSPPHLSHLGSLLQHVMRLSTVAAAEGSPQAGSTEADQNLVVVAVPVLGCRSGNEVLAVAMSVESPEQARATIAYLVQVMTWIAAVIVGVKNRPASSSTGSQDATHFLTTIFAAGLATDSATRYRLFSDWIRETTRCDEVVIGLSRGPSGECKVASYSGHEQFDSRSDRVDLIEEIFDELLIASNVSLMDETLLETEAVRHFQRLTGQQIVGKYVLHDPTGRSIGAILCLAMSERNVQPLAAESVSMIAQQLHWMQQAEPSWWGRIVDRSRRIRWYQQPFVWATVVCTILLLLIPTPLKIKTSCIVQPQQRRFVSVPYEGRLEEALTRPGDVVQAGQLLARMDGRDIQWEIAAFTADLRRAEKNRDTALADSQTAAAQIAGLEAQRLRLQIDELNERLKNLEVRSPVQGVVVSGDPKKLEGGRFAMGDSLVEVAPLAEMLMELRIPDDDISHVRAGQRVRCRLASMPWRSFEGELQTIQPRAELHDNENVFVGFVHLHNADDSLRPGMLGQAKIKGDVHSLGWNLFHKAWNHFVGWVAW